MAIRNLFRTIEHAAMTHIDRATLGCTKCVEAVTALFGLCNTAHTAVTDLHFEGWRHGPDGLRHFDGTDLPSPQHVQKRVFAAAAGALQFPPFFNLLEENNACIAGGTLVAACTPADDATCWRASNLDVYVPTRRHVCYIEFGMRQQFSQWPWILNGRGQLIQSWQDLKIAYSGKVLRLSWTAAGNKNVLVDVVARTLGTEPSSSASIRYARFPPNWGLAASFDIPACAFAYNLRHTRFEWSPAGAHSMGAKVIHLCAVAFVEPEAAWRRYKYIVAKKFAMAARPLLWRHETERRTVRTTADHAAHHLHVCGFFTISAPRTMLRRS